LFDFQNLVDAGHFRLHTTIDRRGTELGDVASNNTGINLGMDYHAEAGLCEFLLNVVAKCSALAFAEWDRSDDGGIDLMVVIFPKACRNRSESTKFLLGGLVGTQTL